MINRLGKISLVLLLVLAASDFQFAQRSKKSPMGPRAVAALEWTGRGLRLVPISLLIDGKLYDASLYRANPVPFALDSGNVYEVQRSGEPIGDFTVSTAEQWANGAWAGNGKYVSEADRQKEAERRAKVSSQPSKPLQDEDEGPPTLRRGGNKSPEPKPEEKPTPKTEEPAAPAKTPELTETTNDPDRPVLRRGKPGTEQAEKLGNEPVPMKVPEKPPAGLAKVQVAVSDPVNTESRPYAWRWADQNEEEKMRAAIERLALSELQGYTAQGNRQKPGRLEDVEIAAFDLEYNNSPDVILSAKARPAAEPAKKGAKSGNQTANAPANLEYYVTVVAREDIYGQLVKSFSMVTDSRHLDVFPRMHLIDAVDIEGNGAGELLFRRISDRGSSFVIYRVYSSRLDELLRVPEPVLQ
ncbi:MAG TPA: hypothetical protein VN577_21260 [Terriglobales bacterium]|nr:hypothetical protein [Terriglobales bacterium]